MHDANLSPGIIFRADSAGIRQAGILLHRKSVQLRAQHDDRTASILQQGNDAGAAYMLEPINTNPTYRWQMAPSIAPLKLKD